MTSNGMNSEIKKRLEKRSKTRPSKFQELLDLIPDKIGEPVAKSARRDLMLDESQTVEGSSEKKESNFYGVWWRNGGWLGRITHNTLGQISPSTVFEYSSSEEENVASAIHEEAQNLEQQGYILKIPFGQLKTERKLTPLSNVSPLTKMSKEGFEPVALITAFNNQEKDPTRQLCVVEDLLGKQRYNPNRKRLEMLTKWNDNEVFIWEPIINLYNQHAYRSFTERRTNVLQDIQGTWKVEGLEGELFVDGMYGVFACGCGVLYNLTRTDEGFTADFCFASVLGTLKCELDEALQTFKGTWRAQNEDENPEQTFNGSRDYTTKLMQIVSMDYVGPNIVEDAPLNLKTEPGTLKVKEEGSSPEETSSTTIKKEPSSKKKKKSALHPESYIPLQEVNLHEDRTYMFNKIRAAQAMYRKNMDNQKQIDDKRTFMKERKRELQRKRSSPEAGFDDPATKKPCLDSTFSQNGVKHNVSNFLQKLFSTLPQNDVYRKYQMVFEREEVDPESAPDIDEDVLKEWKIDRLFHRRKILRAIEKLCC